MLIQSVPYPEDLRILGGGSLVLADGLQQALQSGLVVEHANGVGE